MKVYSGEASTQCRMENENYIVIVHSDIESECGEGSDNKIELMENLEEPDTPSYPLQTPSPSLLSPLAEMVN